MTNKEFNAGLKGITSEKKRQDLTRRWEQLKARKSQLGKSRSALATLHAVITKMQNKAPVAQL